MSDDLAVWLTQIWDEREKIAKAAPPGPWFSTLETGSDAEDFGSVWTDKDGTWASAETVGDWYMPGAGDHIAANDPASVLSRIAADRQILAMHSGDEDDMCQSEAGNWVYMPCQTLRLLALPYVDRPGYQEEWRPRAEG